MVEKDHMKCLYGNGNALQLDWSVSASWLQHYIQVCRMLSVGKLKKGCIGNHCFISCKLNNLKIKRSIKKTKEEMSRAQVYFHIV